MKVALDKVTSRAQNAFIRGRQILDQVLISNECLASRIHSGILSVLRNLDLKMAYDHVDWDFLFTCWEDVCSDQNGSSG